MKIKTPIGALIKKDASEALNVGVSTLDRARKIQRVGSESLNAAVEAGDVTVGLNTGTAGTGKKPRTALVRS